MGVAAPVLLVLVFVAAGDAVAVGTTAVAVASGVLVGSTAVGAAVGAAVGGMSVGAAVNGGAVGAGGSAVGAFEVGGTGVDVGLELPQAVTKTTSPRMASANRRCGAKSFLMLPPWSESDTVVLGVTQ